MIARIQERTGLPVSLHMCGNATPLLPELAQSGADVLELDQHTDMRDACAVVPRHVAIWGNLDPVRVLAHGTPPSVARAATEFLATMHEAGRERFVLSSGCTLAVETPEENLHALVNTAKNHPSQS